MQIHLSLTSEWQRCITAVELPERVVSISIYFCHSVFLYESQRRWPGIMSSSENDRKRGGLLPIPRLSLPNPLAWVHRPKPSRPRKQHFASTSVAMGESMLASPSASVTSLGASGGAGAGASAAAGGASAPSRVPLKPASDVLCGALARAASQSTIHPLDTLKVRGRRRDIPGAAPAVSWDRCAGGGTALLGVMPLPSSCSSPQVRIQARARGATAAPPPGVSKIGQLLPPPAGKGILRLDMKEMGR